MIGYEEILILLCGAGVAATVFIISRIKEIPYVEPLPLSEKQIQEKMKKEMREKEKQRLRELPMNIFFKNFWIFVGLSFFVFKIWPVIAPRI